MAVQSTDSLDALQMRVQLQKSPQSSKSSHSERRGASSYFRLDDRWVSAQSDDREPASYEPDYTVPPQTPKTPRTPHYSAFRIAGNTMMSREAGRFSQAQENVALQKFPGRHPSRATYYQLVMPQDLKNFSGEQNPSRVSEAAACPAIGSSTVYDGFSRI